MSNGDLDGSALCWCHVRSSLLPCGTTGLTVTQMADLGQRAYERQYKAALILIVSRLWGAATVQLYYYFNVSKLRA